MKKIVIEMHVRVAIKVKERIPAADRWDIDAIVKDKLLEGLKGFDERQVGVSVFHHGRSSTYWPYVVHRGTPLRRMV